MLRAPAVAHLVYVHTDYEALPGRLIQSDEAYMSGLDTMFEAFELGVARPAGVSFQRTVIPVGDPASELLAFASANAVDLIVAGTHGIAMRPRLRLGGVSTRLIRSAQCAVLVSGWRDESSSPPSSQAGRDLEEWPT
jgi:nucleotide-binding universal stress UspA family protein